jgi:hypothetical protein
MESTGVYWIPLYEILEQSSEPTTQTATPANTAVFTPAPKRGRMAA